jgi:hypothetical protein
MTATQPNPEKRLYVVTVGTARHFVEALDGVEAVRKVITTWYPRIGLYSYEPAEYRVVEATDAEVATFSRSRARSPAPGEALGLFDVATIPVDPTKQRRRPR